MPGLELVTLFVESYDPAIEFFVDKLGFALVEDSPSLTNDGRPKRWVVVRPPGGQTGILLAQAEGDDQASLVESQVASRVGFFLRVDDFEQTFERMVSNGVEFVSIHGPSHTALSLCSSTSPATAGTCSALWRRSRW